MDRVKALAAAMEEMIGPRTEPASPKPVAAVEAPTVEVETQPASVSPLPMEPAEPPVELVAPEPEPVSASLVEPVEAPAAIEPSDEPAWLRPAEEAEAHVPVELVEPPLEPVGAIPAAPVEPPVELVAPEPEPVSPLPMEPAEAPAAIEPSDEPAWLRPAEEAEGPVELVELPPEPAGVSPAEPVEAPAEAVEPAPVIPGPIEPVEAPPPAAKPSVVRPGLFARLAAALVGMTGPTAEPASPRPVEAVKEPAVDLETQAASVSPPPPEAVEPPEEAPAVIESSGEPAWLQPTEEVEAPVELVEPAPEPASVSPREQAETLIIRGDLEGAWKVYYDALRVEPDDLRLWYGLGRTLSRLNRRKETQEIFQYVVSRGDPDSEEVKHARQWLVGAGLLAEPAAPTVPAAPRSRAEAWATVRGKVTWGKLEPPREVFLVVQGLDKDGSRSHARVPFGQSYQFDRLPAGAYHLIGGPETEWLWDLRFTVEAGQELVLDLSRDNSTNPTARV